MTKFNRDRGQGTHDSVYEQIYDVKLSLERMEGMKDEELGRGRKGCALVSIKFYVYIVFRHEPTVPI